MELVKGLSIIVLIALAGIGWAGYWIEFQTRIEFEKKIKKFYGTDAN